MLGSTVALTNSSGAITTQYTYDPFGNTTVSGSSTNPFQFTGQANDDTGLYYYRARYYSPEFQRFISQDPLGFAGGDANLYGYVADDPIDYIDPLGFIRHCIIKLMLVTSYNDIGPGSNWRYFKPSTANGSPTSVGLGIVADANTAPPPYPYGSTVIVYGPGMQSIQYLGQIQDTGAGWDSRHHNVAPGDWIDIWLPGKQANKWGVKIRWVKICHDEPGKCH